jgi:hypothetical protein
MVMLLPDVYSTSAERVKTSLVQHVDRLASQAICKSSHDLNTLFVHFFKCSFMS